MKPSQLFLTFLAACASLSASAQPFTPSSQYRTTITQLTNLPAHIVGGATSNITSQTFAVKPGKGFAVTAKFAGTNAATTQNLTFTFAVSPDHGTNFTTVCPLVFTAAANTTAAVVAETNFPPALVDNMTQFELLKITSAADPTNRIFLTNVWITVAN